MHVGGRRFAQLVAEAEAHSFSGWDFGYLVGRMVQDPLSWDYRSRVRELLTDAATLLDVDTGGGEVLASLAPLPPHTVATEGYVPNISVARQNLEPLGVKVVELEVNDCDACKLPFSEETFDLIINRHGSFAADEFYRILKHNGQFITQQVGGTNLYGLNEALHATASDMDLTWNLDKASAQLTQAGFTVIFAKEEFPKTTFSDIGAVVYYLRAIPWQLTDFSVDRYIDRLTAIHETIENTGEFVVHAHRFYIEVEREHV